MFRVGGINIISLVDHFSEYKSLHLLPNIFFTSVLLPEELSQRNIFVTGTFIKDRDVGEWDRCNDSCPLL